MAPTIATNKIKPDNIKCRLNKVNNGLPIDTTLFDMPWQLLKKIISLLELK
jgi:hypothetical protein